MKVFVVYDLEDNIKTVCDSYKELSKYLDRDIRSVHSSMCRFRKSQIKYLQSNYDNKYYKIYRIEIGEIK